MCLACLTRQPRLRLGGPQDECGRSFEVPSKYLLLGFPEDAGTVSSVLDRLLVGFRTSRITTHTKNVLDTPSPDRPGWGVLFFLRRLIFGWVVRLPVVEVLEGVVGGFSRLPFDRSTTNLRLPFSQEHAASVEFEISTN